MTKPTDIRPIKHPATPRRTVEARLLDRPEDHRRLGLAPGSPTPKEDGRRTIGHRWEYEWWYFDAKLTDGSSLVIVFYASPVIHPHEGHRPYASFSLTHPDGSVLTDRVEPNPKDCTLAEDRCHVTIGDCVFTGDLNHYSIDFHGGQVQAHIELDGNVPAWRPATGRIDFGKHYFAWIPAVPEGDVSARITSNGHTAHYEGTGYHDHN